MYPRPIDEQFVNPIQRLQVACGLVLTHLFSDGTLLADITNSPNLDNIKPMLYDMYVAAPVQLQAPYPHVVADALLINLGVSTAFQDVW